MEFTGERYVPGATASGQLYVEHMSRYAYASTLVRGKTILDVGCGCGYGTHYLALRGAAFAIGIDRAQEAIDFARTTYKHPALRFAVSDAYQLALKDRFHLVTCFEVFEHVEDPGALLSEMCRVLRDDGLVLISTPNRLTYRKAHSERNPFHFKEYDEDEFIEILKHFFPHSLVFGQFWIEGMFMGRREELSGKVLRSSVLPEEDGKSGAGPQGEPDYFLAICSKCPIQDTILGELVQISIDCKQHRLRDIKTSLSKLEKDFDDRGKWAKRLDGELALKDETIKRLHAELESLREEFDERGRWALSLDKQVQELRAYIEQLKQQQEISIEFGKPRQET